MEIQKASKAQCHNFSFKDRSATKAKPKLKLNLYGKPMAAIFEQTSHMLNHFLQGEPRRWLKTRCGIICFSSQHFDVISSFTFCSLFSSQFYIAIFTYGLRPKCRTRKVENTKKQYTESILTCDYIPSFLFASSSQLSLNTCQVAHLEKHHAQSSFAIQICKTNIFNNHFIQIEEYILAKSHIYLLFIILSPDR